MFDFILTEFAGSSLSAMEVWSTNQTGKNKKIRAIPDDGLCNSNYEFYLTLQNDMWATDV